VCSMFTSASEEQMLPMASEDLDGSCGYCICLMFIYLLLRVPSYMAPLLVWWFTSASSQGAVQGSQS